MKMEETIRVFLGRHEFAQDALDAKEHFDWCDIYVPELAGWNDSTRMGYNAISDTRLSVSGLLTACGLDEFGDYGIAQLVLMAGTGKRVEFVDVPDGHPLATDLGQLKSILEMLPNAGMPRDEALRSLATAFEHFAEANRKREEYIVERVVELTAAHPRERILLRLGTAHSPVVRGLRERGIGTAVVYQRTNHSFDCSSQAYRYARFGRPIPESVLIACLSA